MSRTHHHRGRPKPDVAFRGHKTRMVRFEWDAHHNGWRSDYKGYKYGYWPETTWRAAEKLVKDALSHKVIVSGKAESDEAYIEGHACPALKRLRKELGKLLGLTEAELRHREAEQAKVKR